MWYVVRDAITLLNQNRWGVHEPGHFCLKDLVSLYVDIKEKKREMSGSVLLDDLTRRSRDAGD